MGLFSSIGKIFGGGGSSSTTSSTSTTVKVEPVTNVTLDLDELAQALENGNANELLTESAKIQLLAQEQKLNAQSEAQKIQLEKQNFTLATNTIKTLQSFIPLILVSSVYLVFLKNKKRGKSWK